MKTVREIDKLIETELQDLQQIANELKNERDKKVIKKLNSRKTRVQNELAKLRYYKMYLESGPTEIFLKEEVFKLKNKIELIQKTYGTWCDQSGPKDKDPLKDWPILFNNQTGITTMKKQIKTMEFLLN